MKSHFWKLFFVWYVLLLGIFFSYHSQVTKFRLHDFKIKKILFKEYKEKHQLPAYIALSKSEFHAGRYSKNRDELLQSGEISGYALNQIDELIKVKEKDQFYLSSIMWLGLLVLFLGAVIWLRLLCLFIYALVVKRNLKKTFLRVFVCSLFVGVAFSASKVMAQQFRESVSSEYDFDEAMHIALKIDEYYQVVFEHLISVGNAFFKVQFAVTDEDRKVILDEIRIGLSDMKTALLEFKNLKSAFIDFNGEELVHRAESISDNLLNLSFLMENTLTNSSLAETLQQELKNSRVLFNEFLTILAQRREVLFSEQAKSLFLPEAVREFEKNESLSRGQDTQFSSFSYFLYQAMGYSNR